MTRGKISKRVVGDRLSWVERMVHEIRALSLEDRETFFADRRNVWTAESCLRRALEALLDLGRHILAKGFGLGVSEYKEVASAWGSRTCLLKRKHNFYGYSPVTAIEWFTFTTR